MIKVYVTVCYPDDQFVATTMLVEDDSDHAAILERVFAEWNAGSGSECAMFNRIRLRSLSVNDVVIINGTYYQCASMGWNQISEQEFQEIEASVAKHPHRLKIGAWYTLQSVMAARRGMFTL